MWMQKCNILSISPGFWDDPCSLRLCLRADIPRPADASNDLDLAWGASSASSGGLNK